jgi:MFS family permease
MLNVVFLGLVSFFADISSEMVYPIIPLYLTTVFGTTPALVGVIEGIAESLASLLKVFSGYISDKYKRKKPIAFIGYSAGVFYKFALILAGSWVGVLAARVIDRVGKGIRTAPRDVMVSESAAEGQCGRAFGIHKALDMAGSAIGILASYFLLKYAGDGSYEYKRIFLIAVIPALLSLAMFFRVREKKGERVVKPRESFWKNFDRLDGRLKLYLLVAFLFTLGNSSNAFLLLRAKSLGFDDTSVILLYFVYNVTASLLAIPAGGRSDVVGRKKLLVEGYLVFTAVYLGFAFAPGKAYLAVFFVLYGVYTAMIAGVERAFVAEIAPEELKGTMLGLLSTVVGVALLPASAIAGVLWDAFGAAVPFVFGACLSLAAALILLFFLPGGAPQTASGKMGGAG